MKWLRAYVTSSIGQKQLMGISGVFLYFFLAVHLLGNFGLLAGPQRFNSYSHLLLETLKELIYPTEALLLFAFVLHSLFGIKVSLDNRKAHGASYVGGNPGRAKTLFSSTMAFTGVWLLLFLIIHVPHFRFGVGESFDEVVYNGVHMLDKYSVVIASFANPWYVGFYCLSMIFVGFHLAHGVQSSLQSLGMNHPRYTPTVKVISYVYALVIGAGFEFIAIWSYLQSA
ncbi:MAG: succinate dehydrogenase [Chitinivibrionales bacterium]|nr:succinate dehydrogenase [Chitinivibrionales bacterium]